MAIRQIPVESGVLAFSFKVDLDQRPFRFRFTYNQRQAVWTMNIQDDLGVDLVVGVPIHVKQLLLRQSQHDLRLPQGDLLAVNLVDDTSDPGPDNFGSDVVLLYDEAAE